jgi:hypothetical protein
VLYYIATKGYQEEWENPDHSLHLARAFSSSVSRGRPSDLVGRDIVDFCTADQAYSFIGVQLGGGRKLLPTAYTIRNRPSSREVMLSWRLEGSNDLVTWYMLDNRSIELHNRTALEKLTRRGGTTTWAIDPNACRLDEGFGTFRIIQTDENSAHNHVLGISGFEIYGKVTNAEKWLF